MLKILYIIALIYLSYEIFNEYLLFKNHKEVEDEDIKKLKIDVIIMILACIFFIFL